MPKVPLPPPESITLDSLAEVARGGMGSVELARAMDGRLAGQVLAVKRLHPNIAEDPEFVSMFLDETWMTAALKHPNVAQVVAWGKDDKGMFLAIELVQGVSLSRLMKEAQVNKEPFAERTVAFISSQICAALSAAHTLTAPDGTPLTLVHRDLTPANVLISFDGTVKVIDFGIAKAEERISHTRTGQLKGKPAYMAPEQQRGDAVDARADLFAFGVVMYELLAGRRPWTAKGAFDVMMEIANDPHPDLASLRPGLNPEFVVIAHRCLEKKATSRFDSAAEIKTRLDTWLHAKGFTLDDKQSLASFVQRNCQPQIKWWQEALRGEHAVKKAPTFKELEEQIDEERAKAEKAQRKQAASQAPAPLPPPRPNSMTVPMNAYGTVPPGSQRGGEAPPPSSGFDGNRGFGGTVAMPSSLPHVPANLTPPTRSLSSGSLLRTGAATELLSGARDLGPLPTRIQTQVDRTLDEGEARADALRNLAIARDANGQDPTTSARATTGNHASPAIAQPLPPNAPNAPGPPAFSAASTPLAHASSPAPAESPASSSAARRTAPARKKSRAPVILALCIAIAAGVVGGALLALDPGDGGGKPIPAKKK